MSFLLKLLFKLPPFSLVTLALRYKRKLPGLIWVGALGFLAWQRFGPQVTARLREATADYPPPAAGPWSGATGGSSADSAEPTPSMAVAEDLAPANAAPLVETAADPSTEAETGVTGLVVGDDPAPVTTTG